MMSRRYLRLGGQLAVLATVALLLVLYLDGRYRVLPDRLHHYLPTAHHPGLVVTDLRLQTCSRLNPFGSCSGPAGGAWERIEKDLYLGKAWSRAHLYVARKSETDMTAKDHVLIDVRVSRSDPAKEKGHESEVWERREAGMWIRRDQRDSQKIMATDAEPITAVNVLFGTDAADPRPQWDLLPIPLLLSGAAGPHGSLAPRISVRRGAEAAAPKRPTIKVNKSGKMKLLQVSDLHFSTGLGECRDPEPPESASHCEADVRTTEFVGRMLDEEKPDLVVLSGDMLNGEGHIPDAESALLKVTAMFIERQIPYAAMFGNHDDEGNLDRTSLMEILEALPFNVARAGPKEVDGVGNYYLEISDHSISSHSAVTLYVLDTHGLSPDDVAYPGYDWLKPSQLQWFANTSVELNARHAREGYSRKHLNMAFLHIPLPEYRGEQGDGQKVVGSWQEEVTAPLKNTGMARLFVESGVLTVGCGHDHVNEYCMLQDQQPQQGEGTEAGEGQSVEEDEQSGGEPELWMCYAGGSGFGGYGGHDHYQRKVRVWEIDTNLGRITTWKRAEWAPDPAALDAHIDEQVIVRNGKVADE